MLLEDAIRISNTNDENLFNNPLFSDCYSTINNSSEINLMINYNSLLTLSDIFTTVPVKLTHFSEWTATDIKFEDNAILASGLSAFNSTVHNFTDIFNTQKSQNLSILDILPQNTTQLFAITFNSQQQLYEKKNEILRIKHQFMTWDKNRQVMEKKGNINYNDFLS